MSRSSVARALVAVGMLAASAARLLAQTGHWVNISPEGGTILALAVDPLSQSTIDAGCSDGIFKSVNGGSSWTPMKSA
ncbi:MAG TPA: hypothetical protein VMR54_04995 [Thermoanaerobaculia bacterium]|nr:hypothetical protein [Thermoanaerobaculia bacterium]